MWHLQTWLLAQWKQTPSPAAPPPPIIKVTSLWAIDSACCYSSRHQRAVNKSLAQVGVASGLMRRQQDRRPIRELHLMTDRSWARQRTFAAHKSAAEISLQSKRGTARIDRAKVLTFVLENIPFWETFFSPIQLLQASSNHYLVSSTFDIASIIL